MKSTLQAIQNWYQAIPSGRRWIVWTFAAILTVFSFMVVEASSYSGGSLASNKDFESAGLFFDVLVKLAVVVVLIYASAKMYQKWNRRTLGETRRLMNVRETARLSAKQALHIVQVGDDVFLIGATDQNITLIATVDPGEMESQPAAKNDLALDFRQIFKARVSDSPEKAAAAFAGREE